MSNLARALLVATINLIFLVLLLNSGCLYTRAATVFDKSNFRNPLEIDNKYLPLKPGTTLIYEGKNEDGPTRDVFAVTNDTKEIMGIPTRVVHDDGYVKGEHEETTNDWFAQDNQG